MVNKEITDKFNTLCIKIDVTRLKQIKSKLEEAIAHPEFWQNVETATSEQKEYSQVVEKIKNIEDIKGLIENLEIAAELNEDESALELLEKEILSKIETQTNLLFLNEEFDNKNVFLSINSGAGGVDAQDWASMLASMYQAFFKNQGWKSTIINLSTGDEGGVKSITIKVEGLNAYGLLKEEFGVHRLVRLSPFNSAHTRETSFASVQVVPIIEDVDHKFKIDINENDLSWDYYLSGGKGGQSVNTTYSAVRLTHLPTNIVVTCQNERSQVQNKAQALTYLKSKLAVIEAQKLTEFKNQLKGDLSNNEFGSQIRNYVLHPYKKIKDLRSNFEVTDTDSVLVYGDLLDIIWSVKKSYIQNYN